MVKQVPITDPGKTPGYSWLRWQESRETGSEVDTRDKFGEIDEGKKRRRDELIQEGKLTSEEFDSAMNATAPAFYTSLSGGIGACVEAFRRTRCPGGREIRQQRAEAGGTGKSHRGLRAGYSEDLQGKGRPRRAGDGGKGRGKSFGEKARKAMRDQPPHGGTAGDVNGISGRGTVSNT